MKFKWLVNCAILIFLGLNLYFPIRGLGTQKSESWGEFTWNMYSQTYRCGAKYYLLEANGRAVNVDIRKYMQRGPTTGHVFHRDVLPLFHAFLCEQLAAEGRTGELRGECECSVAGGTSVELVDTTVNLCTAANHGVLTSGE